MEFLNNNNNTGIPAQRIGRQDSDSSIASRYSLNSYTNAYNNGAEFTLKEINQKINDSSFLLQGRDNIDSEWYSLTEKHIPMPKLTIENLELYRIKIKPEPNNPRNETIYRIIQSYDKDGGSGRRHSRKSNKKSKKSKGGKKSSKKSRKSRRSSIIQK